ncbi:MAG: hypothetical protein H7240_00835 [Glaciimonas sp.]|nr:hypothetical protein [Glaciimonas sp.]
MSKQVLSICSGGISGTGVWTTCRSVAQLAQNSIAAGSDISNSDLLVMLNVRYRGSYLRLGLVFGDDRLIKDCFGLSCRGDFPCFPISGFILAADKLGGYAKSKTGQP